MLCKCLWETFFWRHCEAGDCNWVEDSIIMSGNFVWVTFQFPQRSRRRKETLVSHRHRGKGSVFSLQLDNLFTFAVWQSNGLATGEAWTQCVCVCVCIALIAMKCTLFTFLYVAVPWEYDNQRHCAALFFCAWMEWGKNAHYCSSFCSKQWVHKLLV